MPLNRRRARRLSRPDAFAAQGVALKFPARSWSGVRSDDGAVVLAIRAADVIVDEYGCHCLLWAPFGEDAACPSKQERREHCRLAVLHGAAEGLLAYGDSAEVSPELGFSLRVQQRRGAYWAKWSPTAAAVRRSTAQASHVKAKRNIYPFLERLMTDRLFT
jgi:hypothetical protein